ncbi:MAG TPA: amidophosphoribosyltransferase [Thermomicrobiales bacterium]|nr:amidophosphoribosyltransferase [Thermomicrobiales bacterium]
MLPELDGDSPKEECGIFGVHAPGADVARMTFFGLYALQHRGQESAGIAVARQGEVRLRKQMGLVGQVFSEGDLRHLTGDIAVGHTRYSTTGSTLPENAGPMAAESDLGTIVVAHNGNTVNALELRDELVASGARLQTTTDSELLAHLIARTDGITIVEKLRGALDRVTGAYSLAVLTPDQIVAVRDPHGIRPLCLGRLPDGWVVASETCALATVGATYEREIEPGEILVISAEGLHSASLIEHGERALCVFELIYFARPDSQLRGERLHLVRQRMGEQLAREHPIEADVVIPIPDSGVPAAIGYARESGIPYAEGLIKNRYIGRTFIQPDQRLREIGVQLKFNALPEVLAGKRVVLIDDTIVRGTTSRPIVNMIRAAGAAEVHMRVHAPPVMHPCHLGVDMASREELIAANLTIPEIREQLGVDTLGYLSHDGLFRAIRQPANEFCSACLTGSYPVDVDAVIDKHALERTIQRV